MNDFGGQILFLDRSNINTDEIIPAKYLTEIEKDALKPHLFEDLNIEGFDPQNSLLEDTAVIVTRENFGCGSSREHAVWALEVNRFKLIISRSFARIFRQNMFNCGLMAIELSNEIITELFNHKDKKNISCSVDIEKKQLQFHEAVTSFLKVNFSMDSFYEELIKAGGWVEYADKKY